MPYNVAIELCIEPNFRAVTEVGISLWGLLSACRHSRLVALDEWCEQDKAWLTHPENHAGSRLLRVLQALRGRMDLKKKRKELAKWDDVGSQRRIPEKERRLMDELFKKIGNLDNNDDEDDLFGENHPMPEKQRSLIKEFFKIPKESADVASYDPPSPTFHPFPGLPFAIQIRIWSLAFDYTSFTLGSACQQWHFGGVAHVNLGGTIQKCSPNWEILPGIINRLLKPTHPERAFQGNDIFIQDPDMVYGDHRQVRITSSLNYPSMVTLGP